MAHLAHYREAHPLPFVITHWINIICMCVLIFTGFYIHFAFFPDFMGIARGCHIFFGFLLVIDWITRMVMSFFIESAPTGGTRKKVRDIKTWLPQKDNRHQGGAWIRYYLFLKKDHPLSAKLGVPQKISYLLIPWVIFIMCYTGCCLWGPTMDWAFFAWGTDLVGGAMSMRIIHYFLMYLLIIFIFLHVYLANIEGAAPTRLMLFRQEHGGLVYDPDKHVIVGVDDLGEGEKEKEKEKEENKQSA